MQHLKKSIVLGEISAGQRINELELSTSLNISRTPIRYALTKLAEQMYIAMKKHGVETRLVTFPKSAHGLSREGLPNLRLERLEEISNWFENH